MSIAKILQFLDSFLCWDGDQNDRSLTAPLGSASDGSASKSLTEWVINSSTGRRLQGDMRYVTYRATNKNPPQLIQEWFLPSYGGWTPSQLCNYWIPFPLCHLSFAPRRSSRSSSSSSSSSSSLAAAAAAASSESEPPLPSFWRTKIARNNADSLYDEITPPHPLQTQHHVSNIKNSYMSSFRKRVFG